MAKKILSLFLSVSIFLSVAPLYVYGENTIHPLEVGEMDFRNAKTNLQGNGWQWDAEQLTLKLEKFSYQLTKNATEDAAAIYLPENAFVEIEGENRLETQSYHNHAFYCEGAVHFYGDGKLEIFMENSGSHAIHLRKGPLVMDDEVEIAVVSRGYLIFMENAKGTSPLIRILEQAKLSFKIKEHEYNHILLITKSNANSSSNWFDYVEQQDAFDSAYMNLVAKNTTNTTSEKNIVTITTESSDTYQIIIGSAEIQKNGKTVYTADVMPYLNADGYTMLPLRALLMTFQPEQQIIWDNQTKSVHTTVKKESITIPPTGKNYIKSSQAYPMRTAAEVKNGRMFLSLRDWMDIMQIETSQVDWNPETKTVTVKY